MITRIAYTNFKGATADHRLGASTLITGPNFAGKSTVLQALTLAMTGTVADLGRSAAAIFQASSGPEMRVEAAFNDGTRIERIYKQSGKKGAVKATTAGTAPPLNLFIGETFTGAKPEARLAMLANFSGGDAKELEEELAAQRKKHNAKLEGESVFENADQMLELLSDKEKEARARKTQFEKTINGLVELTGEGADPPPDLSKQIADLRAAHGNAQKLSAEAEEAGEEAQDAAADLEALLEEYPDADQEPPTTKEAVEKFNDLGEQIAAIAPSPDWTRDILKAGNATSGPAPTPPDKAHLEKLVRLNATDWKEELRGAKEANRASYQALQKARITQGELEERRKQIDATQCCTLCGSERTEWKAAALEKIEAQLKELATSIEHEKQFHDRTAADVTKYQGHLDALADLPELQRAQEAVERYAQDSAWLEENGPKYTEATAKQKGLAEQRCALQEEIGTLDGRRSRFERYTALSQLAAEVPARKEATAKAWQDEAQAEKALQKILAQDEENAAKRKEFEAISLRRRDLEAARLEAEKSAEELQKLVADSTRLQETKDTAMRQLYAPVLAAAREFTKGILKTELELHPVNGQIGRYEGLNFIPFNLLSGAEKMAALAALQVALAMGGSRILILDETSRMDATTKAKFLNAVIAAIEAGTLKQAIILDHDETHPGYTGWTKIRV